MKPNLTPIRKGLFFLFKKKNPQVQITINGRLATADLTPDEMAGWVVLMNEFFKTSPYTDKRNHASLAMWLFIDKIANRDK